MQYTVTLGLLFLGMAVYGSGAPVSKLVAGSFSPLVGSFLRMGFAALALTPFILYHRRRLRQMTWRDWLYVGIIAGVGMITFSMLMLYGMQQVSGVVGSIVMSTTPAVTAFGAALFLKEPFRWKRVVAIALAVIGVLIINIFGAEAKNTTNTSLILGTVMILGAVASEAVHTLVGHRATQKLPPLLLAGLATWGALLLFVPFAYSDLLSTQWALISALSWAATLWWGLGTLALGSGLWYSGIKRASGSAAAGFMAVMPLSALLLSYLLLGEPFQLIHLVGFALVFAGVLLISQEYFLERLKKSGCG